MSFRKETGNFLSGRPKDVLAAGEIPRGDGLQAGTGWLAVAALLAGFLRPFSACEAVSVCPDQVLGHAPGHPRVASHRPHQLQAEDAPGPRHPPTGLQDPLHRADQVGPPPAPAARRPPSCCCCVLQGVAGGESSHF